MVSSVTIRLQTALVQGGIIAAALLATLLLFAMLASLIYPGDLRLSEPVASPALNFLLIEAESELELRNRQRPPEPEPLTEPPRPVMSEPVVTQTLAIETPSVDLNVPAITVDLQVDLSNALAGISPPSDDVTNGLPSLVNPRALREIPPRYPPRAQRRRIEGRLKVQFIVDPEGYVQRDSIVFIEAEPKGVFEKSVRRSLKQARFESMIVNGQAVAYRATKAYNYEMAQ